jgi:excisionase family DNA binding protein
MMKLNDFPEIMEAKEVALYLRLSMPTVYKYLRQGKIKGIKLGGTYWKIKRSEIEKK